MHHKKTTCSNCGYQENVLPLLLHINNLSKRTTMIGIFFGSTTGNTEAAAQDIAAALGTGAVFNVGSVDAASVADYDTLLLGSSTWGAGDLQDDWYDFLDALKAQDLNGKKVGLFGCGDSDGYGDTFCGALRQIYDALQDCGCTFVGAYEPEGYQVTDSEVNVDGKFVGLCLDEADADNNPARIAAWVELVK